MSRLLLCVLEHPTQYDPPLWSCLTRRQKLRPVVFYQLASVPPDSEISIQPRWGHVPGDGYELYAGSYSRLLRELASRELRPSAVLASGWTRPLNWGATLICLSRGIPCILPSDRVEAQGATSRFRRLLMVLKNQPFSGFFTTGSRGADVLQAQGVRSEQIATGLYPVDVQWWLKRREEGRVTSEALRSWAGHGNPVVLAVSKMSEREAPLTIIDAFARLHSDRPDARLIYVGDGPMRATAEARVAALGLEREIRMVGYVPYTALGGYYGAADVFLHAAEFEPWGISICEALACGVPVVASRNVGAAEQLLTELAQGSLANSRTPDSLAASLDAVLRARGDKTLEKTHAAAALVDVEAASSSLEALVDRLVHGTQRTPLHVAVRRSVWGN